MKLFGWTAAALLAMTAAGSAQEWKKIEPSQSALIINLPAFKGAKPTYFDRSDGMQVRGSSMNTANTDRAGYAANGQSGVFWYDWADQQSTWKPETLRTIVESLNWVAGKNLAITPGEQRYSRDGVEGKYTLFTYRPQTADRHCVIGQFMAASARSTDRVTAVVCQAVGSALDNVAAKAILDQIGSKALPPIVTAAVTAPAPATNAPAAATGATADRLKALKDLFDQKLITAAEYEQKRKAIIDGL